MGVAFFYFRPMKKLIASLSFLFIWNCANAQDPVDYVDPFIGTTNFGMCNPGACLSEWFDVGRSF